MCGHTSKGPFLLKSWLIQEPGGKNQGSNERFEAESPQDLCVYCAPWQRTNLNELRFIVPKLWQLAVFCTCRNLVKELRFAKKFPLRKQCVSELLFSNFVMCCHTWARQWIHFELKSRLIHNRATRIRIALLWFDSRASSTLPYLHQTIGSFQMTGWLKQQESNTYQKWSVMMTEEPRICCHTSNRQLTYFKWWAD